MNKAKLREILEITAGVLIMSAGFYFFLLPLSLVIGGVMGVAVFNTRCHVGITFLCISLISYYLYLDSSF